MSTRLALAVALLTGLAQAAPVRPVRLQFERSGAAACPDEQWLRSAVAARLGFDPFEPAAPAVVIVTIGDTAPGFQARLTLVDERGDKKTRSLTGSREDCSDLREALALSLSVALEAFTSTPPASVLEASPPVGAEPVVSPPAVFTPFVTLGGGLALGAAPAPTGALWLGGGLERRWFSAALEARAVLPGGVSVATGRLDVSAVSLDALVCFVARPLTLLDTRACALGAGGVTFSSASGLDGSRSAVTPLAAVGGRLEVSLKVVWQLWLSLRGELRGALARTALKVGEEAVWTTPLLGGTVGLALTARFDVTDVARADK